MARAAHPSVYKHAAVSQDLEDLWKLTAHQDKGVRACVAANPNTPVALQLLLSSDEAREVRAALLENASLNPYVRRKLLSDATSEARSIMETVSPTAS